MFTQVDTRGKYTLGYACTLFFLFLFTGNRSFFTTTEGDGLFCLLAQCFSQCYVTLMQLSTLRERFDELCAPLFLLP